LNGVFSLLVHGSECNRYGLLLLAFNSYALQNMVVLDGVGCLFLGYRTNYVAV